MGSPTEIHLGNVKYIVYILWLLWLLWFAEFSWFLSTNKTNAFLDSMYYMTTGLLVLYLTIIWAQMKDPILWGNKI